MAMHCIKREPSLAKYFDKDYDFVKVSDLLYSVYSVDTVQDILIKLGIKQLMEINIFWLMSSSESTKIGRIIKK